MEESKIEKYLTYKLEKKLAMDAIKRLDEQNASLRVEVEDYFIKENLKNYKKEGYGSISIINYTKYDTDKIINELLKADFLPKELVNKLLEIKIYPNDFINKFNDLDEETGQINIIEKKEKTLNFVINTLKRGYNETYNIYEDYINNLLEKFSSKTKQIRTKF